MQTETKPQQKEQKKEFAALTTIQHAGGNLTPYSRRARITEGKVAVFTLTGLTEFPPYLAPGTAVRFDDGVDAIYQLEVEREMPKSKEAAPSRYDRRFRGKSISYIVMVNEIQRTPERRQKLVNDELAARVDEQLRNQATSVRTIVVDRTFGREP